jgi:hypothetical protein
MGAGGTFCPRTVVDCAWQVRLSTAVVRSTLPGGKKATAVRVRTVVARSGGGPMRVGDYEGLLDHEVRVFLDRTQEEWRELPLERAQELAMNARVESDEAVIGLSERIALLQAIGIEIAKGRLFGFEVLDDAVVAAYGEKPATEFGPSEKRAIAGVIERIWNRAPLAPAGQTGPRS